MNLTITIKLQTFLNHKTLFYTNNTYQDRQTDIDRVAKSNISGTKGNGPAQTNQIISDSTILSYISNYVMNMS